MERNKPRNSPTLRVRVMGLERGRGVALDELDGARTLREALPSLIGPEVASLAERAGCILSAGEITRQADPDRMKLEEITALFNGEEEVTVHLGVNARGGAGPLRITTAVQDRLGALGAAVDDVVGRVEFAVVLLGPRGEDLVTDCELIRGQEVTYGSFEAADEAIQRTLCEVFASPDQSRADLELKGVGHRHPGTGPEAVFHSYIDVRYIEGELMPMIAALGLEPVCWTMPIELSSEVDGARQLALDRLGRQIVTLHGGAGGALTATLAIEEQRADVFSLVFSRDNHYYCCHHQYRFVPIATPDGGTALKVVHRHEPDVLVVEDAAGAAPSTAAAGDVLALVKAHVRRPKWRFGGFGKKAKNAAKPGATSLAPRSGASRSTTLTIDPRWSQSVAADAQDESDEVLLACVEHSLQILMARHEDDAMTEHIVDALDTVEIARALLGDAGPAARATGGE